MKTYIPKFNERFSVEPANTADLHRKLDKKEMRDLQSIFSHHETRVVQNDFTISYKNQWFQLVEGQPVTVCKKDRVTIEKHLDGSIKIRLRDKYLNYEILPERPKRAKTKNWVLPKISVTKPAADHPWRRTIASDIASSKID